MDIVEQINAVHRQVTGEPGDRSVLLRRNYPATPEEVWDACTNPERIPRWFLPVSGELKLGGKYQLEGNAGGEIQRCEAPKVLRVSWIFGEIQPSFVELRLAAEGGGTLFELEHSRVDNPEMWPKFGPGAVGVGWDGALLGLYAYLTGSDLDDKTWDQSAEAREFMTLSSKAWGEAHESYGAGADEAAAAVAATTAFYVPG